MNRFKSEQHSEFFRRSLSAWERHAPEGWPVHERLTADIGHKLTVDRINAWFDEILRSITARPESTWPKSSPNSMTSEPASAAQVGQALRRVRNWLMLCLIERDLNGLADLAEVCGAMTEFAEFASQQALTALTHEFKARHGVPLDSDGQPQDLMVIAMGKAGGGELNVSSDLDVVFVARDGGDPNAGGISSAEFFHQLARQWVALMSNNDEFGFVFRVDTRLRPDGDSGPLVTTLPMLEHYFFGQAREWERFAWLKSRCIASCRMAGEALQAADLAALNSLVQPFVFRRYHDFNAFNALRELHGKIRHEVGKADLRREGSFDVKLGRGGIREIEFIAQLFQIVRGGRDPDLRSRSTLSTLATLGTRGLLGESDARQLAQAYELLRRTEHALQYREDAQTHRLAAGAAEQQAIAQMLNMAPQQFAESLAQACQRVQQVFDGLLSDAPNGATSSTTSSTAAAGSTPATTVPVVQDPDVTNRIAALNSSARFQNARRETQQAVRTLLGRAAELNTSAVGITRLIDLIEAVIGRPAYLTLLSLYPKAFARVLDMLTKAKWAAEYLTRHPIVLDELLDGQLLERIDYRAWGKALAAQLAQMFIPGTTDQPDVERQMDTLREAHHAQEFHLLAQDLDGLLSVERLSDHLSELADQVLSIALELLWSQSPLRFREQPRFAIIAFGKLGGKELGYASDLDLVFLYDDDDERAVEAYSRLAQRLSGWLSLRTAAGILFEIDLRLRPNGNAGLLVTSVEGFRSYQQESAWGWEHQALTRARFAAGDASIGERFELIRQEIISKPRDRLALAASVREMRDKMLAGHPNRSELFDLKHDRGGMVDIEFVVQFLVLAYSAQHPPLRADAGNIALLTRAGELGLIDAPLAAQVGNVYRQYRQLQHGLRLNGASYSRVPRESVSESVLAVLKLWRATLEA